jgi:hypothetical protein
MSSSFSKIAKVSYISGQFTVVLDGEQSAYVVRDSFNQRAIDAAFTRRASVVLELDGDRVKRVQSDVPPENQPTEPTGLEVITRISTQVNGTTGRIFAEVFIKRRGETEQQVFAFDDVIHGLCHTSYVARQSLSLDVDEQNEIVGVTKSHVDSRV